MYMIHIWEGKLTVTEEDIMVINVTYKFSSSFFSTQYQLRKQVYP